MYDDTKDKIIIMALHKTVLRVLSVATSSSVVVPVVLHSYPLCVSLYQQPVGKLVGLGGGRGRKNREHVLGYRVTKCVQARSMA